MLQTCASKIGYHLVFSVDITDISIYSNIYDITHCALYCIILLFLFKHNILFIHKNLSDRNVIVYLKEAWKNLIVNHLLWPSPYILYQVSLEQSHVQLFCSKDLTILRQNTILLVLNDWTIQDKHVPLCFFISSIITRKRKSVVRYNF